MSDDTVVIATLLGLAAITLYMISTKATVGQVVTKVEGELGSLADTLLPKGEMKTTITKSSEWVPSQDARNRFKRETHAPPSEGIATDRYLDQTGGQTNATGQYDNTTKVG